MNPKSPKLKLTELKKELKRLSQSELIDLLAETYKQHEAVQLYITSRLTGETKPSVKVKSSKEAADLKGWKMWLEIPADFRNQIVGNVWCMSCSDVVTIRDFTVQSDKLGMVLNGVCSTCGRPVVRVVD